MKKYISACVIFAALSFAQPGAAFADTFTDAEMVSLQVAMQSHIDSVLVDGALLALNPDNGKVMAYYPAKAHPKIMTFGEHIILCADVVDANGKVAMANFYVANDKGRYVVFSTTIGADPILEKLMKDGKVAMAN